MNNYTMDLYEMKREIVNFSKKISAGLNKTTEKFIMDMQYGIAKSSTCLISGIARELDEDIKLNYTIERLCDNLTNLTEEEITLINNNYIDISYVVWAGCRERNYPYSSLSSHVSRVWESHNSCRQSAVVR